VVYARHCSVNGHDGIISSGGRPPAEAFFERAFAASAKLTSALSSASRFGSPSHRSQSILAVAEAQRSDRSPGVQAAIRYYRSIPSRSSRFRRMGRPVPRRSEIVPDMSGVVASQSAKRIHDMAIVGGNGPNNRHVVPYLMCGYRSRLAVKGFARSCSHGVRRFCRSTRVDPPSPVL